MSSGPVSFAGYYGHAFTYDRRGTRIAGHERFAVHMRFSGTSVHGSVTDTFTSSRLRCHSGPVYFTAWRDGTAQAPLDTTSGSTGHYAGTASSGDHIGMDVFLPLGEVLKLTVSFRAGLLCSGGLHPTGTEKVLFHNLLINGTGFRFSGHSAYSKAGYRYVESYTILGGPLRKLRWIDAVNSYHAGREIGNCHTHTPGGEQFMLTPPRGRTV